MSKITLNPVGSLLDITTAQTAINANFNVIETAFDNTLSRDGTSPDQMASTLDMNSQRIINLPAPVGISEPLRLGDVSSIAGNITINAIPVGGTTGQALEKTSNTDYAVGWANTVSSVGLSLPSDFTVTNSPVTTTGTLTGAWALTPTGTGSVVRTNSPTLVTPNLGTPSVVTLTNATGLPISSGVSGLAAGASTFLTTPSSANLRTLMTDETGTGSLVFAGGALGAATATSINGSTVSPGHYSGEPSNGAALAGEIGELITAQVLSGSAISLTSGAATNIISISLTAGEWDINAGVQFVTGATTSTTFQGVWMSTTSATFSGLIDDGYVSYNGGAFVNYNAAYSTSTKTLKLSATTTVFLSVLSNFTVSTSTAFGKIRARRVR